MDTGLLILRLAVGLTLAAHGAQKLFGAFGGHGLAGTGGFLEKIGFRPGRRHARLAGLTEFGAGLLLAVGLLTPLAAAGFLGVLFVASVSVHGSNGFFGTSGGFEYPFVLAVAAWVTAFTGPGAYSIDRALGLKLGGIGWGIGAALVGLGTATFVLGGRHVGPADTDAGPGRDTAQGGEAAPGRDTAPGGDAVRGAEGTLRGREDTAQRGREDTAQRGREDTAQRRGAPRSGS